ncbi:DNA gyrase inhibitor YacG [Devosia sp.]|uniref:DNA gyrase inhibitor YacG n=1 Tax=Devosia sp. TaxID=1871048 RepID=UPI0035ADF22F
MADNVIRLRPVRPCPICGRPSSQLTHPFCSTRCADIDLNRWLSGAYVIPAATGEAADAAPSDDAGTDGDGD